MKKVFVFVIIAVTCVSFAVQAQKLKFGHINSAALLQLMPEIKEADKQLEEYAKQMELQNQNMLNAYQQEIQRYQREQVRLSDIEKEIRMQEISDMEKRILSFQQSAQDKLLQKKEELYTPHLKRAEEAIKAVAKEHGYSYVFDTSTGAVLYSQESDDIMPLVKQKMGLK